MEKALSVILTATTATNCNKADNQDIAFNAVAVVAVEKTRREIRADEPLMLLQ